MKLNEVMFSLPFVGWFVCLLAGLRKHYRPDFHETRWKGLARAKEEPAERVLKRNRITGRIHEFRFTFANVARNVLFQFIHLTLLVPSYVDIVELTEFKEL